eukprot:844416-Amphidinium_carterae.1
MQVTSLVLLCRRCDSGVTIRLCDVVTQEWSASKVGWSVSAVVPHTLRWDEVVKGGSPKRGEGEWKTQRVQVKVVEDQIRLTPVVNLESWQVATRECEKGSAQ